MNSSHQCTVGERESISDAASARVEHASASPRNGRLQTSICSAPAAGESPPITHKRSAQTAAACVPRGGGGGPGNDGDAHAMDCLIENPFPPLIHHS